MARQSSWASPLCCFCLPFWLNARGERQCPSPKGSPLFHTLSSTREHLVAVSGSPLLGYFSGTCFPVQSCSRGSVNQRAFASLSGDGDFPAPILTSLICSSIGVWSSAHFPQHPSVTFLLPPSSFHQEGFSSSTLYLSETMFCKLRILGIFKEVNL